MAKKNPAFDAYIARARPFAQPILERIRKLVHRACPDCVEVIKWGMPSFDYKGPFCSMAAFKAHCRFAFWKSALLESSGGGRQKDNRTAIAQLGRITAADPLPDDATIVALVRQAKALNDQGVRVPRVVKKKPPLRVPPAFLAAIRRNQAALSSWERFPPSHQREYVEWIGEAKTEATRERRMAQMLDLLADGKSLHWKYQRK